MDELVDFKNDMIKMIKNIEFRKNKCTFQTKLTWDIKKTNESNELLIPADKSRNIYIMQKDDYNKYIKDNVTKTCKRSTADRLKNINYKIKLLAEKLAIGDRIEKMKATEAYTTVKDHKESFPHKFSFHLINPSKSDIGQISKNLLDKINKILILIPM